MDAFKDKFSVTAVVGKVAGHKVVSVVVHSNDVVLTKDNYVSFCQNELREVYENCMSRSYTIDELDRIYADLYFGQYMEVETIKRVVSNVGYVRAVDVRDDAKVTLALMLDLPVLDRPVGTIEPVKKMDFDSLQWSVRS